MAPNVITLAVPVFIAAIVIEALIVTGVSSPTKSAVPEKSSSNVHVKRCRPEMMEPPSAWQLVALKLLSVRVGLKAMVGTTSGVPLRVALVMPRSVARKPSTAT